MQEWRAPAIVSLPLTPRQGSRLSWQHPARQTAASKRTSHHLSHRPTTTTCSIYEKGTAVCGPCVLRSSFILQHNMAELALAGGLRLYLRVFGKQLVHH